MKSAATSPCSRPPDLHTDSRLHNVEISCSHRRAHAGVVLENFHQGDIVRENDLFHVRLLLEVFRYSGRNRGSYVKIATILFLGTAMFHQR